jgi:hypothetical protein
MRTKIIIPEISLNTKDFSSICCLHSCTKTQTATVYLDFNMAKQLFYNHRYLSWLVENSVLTKGRDDQGTRNFQPKYRLWHYPALYQQPSIIVSTKTFSPYPSASMPKSVVPPVTYVWSVVICSLC